MNARKLSAIMLIILSAPFVSSCRKTDTKAGYPGKYGQENTPAAQRSSDASSKNNYKPPMKVPPGPAGALAAKFCSLSTAADFDGLAKLFSAEFMVRAGIPADAEKQLGDAELDRVASGTYAVIAQDIKTSRVRPVEECEITSATVSDCDTAATQTIARYPEKTTTGAITSTLDALGAKKCGFISVREISDAGIQESSFLVADPLGEWKILLRVTEN